MKLRTELEIKKIDDLIQTKSSILSVGSCFADNIGNKLKKSGFDIEVNPFGIIFNPFSILNALISAQNGVVDEALHLKRDGHYFNYNCHSDLSANSANELSDLIKSKQIRVKDKLVNGDVLQITFGTAWVYQLLDSDKIVANCHKVPQKEFKKSLLNLDILKSIYNTFFTELFQQHPKLKVILSVSPVRHTKDGLAENNISKSILTLLADDLQVKFAQVYYFPAYELVIDDLRDYRFFKEDMVHPTDQAINYVYDAYKKTYCSGQCQEYIALAEKLEKAKTHRFMNASTIEIQKHQDAIQRMENDLIRLRG